MDRRHRGVSMEDHLGFDRASHSVWLEQPRTSSCRRVGVLGLKRPVGIATETGIWIPLCTDACAGCCIRSGEVTKPRAESA